MFGYRPRYWLKHPLNLIGAFYRHFVKWPLQRARRGYSDYDLWGFDSYLAGMLKNALNEMADIAHGYPCGMEGIDTFEDWTTALRKMAAGFEAAQSIVEDTYYVHHTGYKMTSGETDERGLIPVDITHNNDGDDYETRRRKEAEQRAIFEEGVDLFKLYFFNLWD